MQIQLTRKLAAKLKEAYLEKPSRKAPSHLVWCAHLFYANRLQYVITVHAATLFTVVSYGKGLVDFDSYFRQFSFGLREQLAAHRLAAAYQQLIAPYADSMEVSLTNDRSLLSYINQLVLLCRYSICDGNPSPYELSLEANSTIHVDLKHGFPHEAMAHLCTVLDGITLV